jgi:hypothetical protein
MNEMNDSRLQIACPCTWSDVVTTLSEHQCACNANLP